MQIKQAHQFLFPEIVITIENHKEAQILYRMAGLFAEKHARGPVEIAFARYIEKWMAANIAIDRTI